MKKIINEFGDILLGVAIFTVLVVGVAGASFSGEVSRIGTSGISQLTTNIK